MIDKYKVYNILVENAEKRVKNSQELNEGKNEGNPAQIYFDKLELFGKQSSWMNLKQRWEKLDREQKETNIMYMLMHNFPITDTEHPFGFFLSMMKRYMPWSDWIAGINHEFDTLLTERMFKENFIKCQKWSTIQNGVDQDKDYIRMMKSNGARGKTAKQLEGVTKVAGSFRELYIAITDPVYDKLYGKKYVSKSMTGRRGRPVPGGTYIEFNMKKLPVMMVRGKFPFSDSDPDMNDCYALVGMLKPKKTNGYDEIRKWITSLKNTFRSLLKLKGHDVEYTTITPCSLDYWMEEIERRTFTDTDLLGYSKTKKKLFRPTSVLQLREDGSYRFYAEDAEDNEGWISDPMQDSRMITMMPDEYGTGGIRESFNSAGAVRASITNEEYQNRKLGYNGKHVLNESQDEITVKKVGEHYMDGGLYVDQRGRYYCDCFNDPEPDGTISVCRLSPADDPDGEPDVSVIAKCLTPKTEEYDYKFQYQMLSRLIDDARAYFDNPDDYRYHNDNAIWGNSIVDHMKRARELWEEVPVKPKWCTEDDITKYETLAARR